MEIGLTLDWVIDIDLDWKERLIVLRKVVLIKYILIWLTGCVPDRNTAFILDDVTTTYYKIIFTKTLQSSVPGIGTSETLISEFKTEKSMYVLLLIVLIVSGRLMV